MRLRLAQLSGAATAVVVGVVLAAPTTARAGGGAVAIEIHGYQYHPDPVTVEVGQPVTWTNEDAAHHDIATSSAPVAFASPMLETGQTFTTTFTQPGSYQYLCSIHPDMVGALTVVPAAVAPVAAAPAAPATTTPAPTAAASAPNAGVVLAAPSAPPATAAATTPAPAPVSAVVQPRLASAIRPFAALLAVVAAVVTACLLLLLGVGRRAEEAPDA